MNKASYCSFVGLKLKLETVILYVFKQIRSIFICIIKDNIQEEYYDNKHVQVGSF